MGPHRRFTAIGTAGSSGKRSHEDSEEESLDFSQFQPRELQTMITNTSCNGVVVRLHLRNFMCHDSLEVTFNRRVNFVVGRNGSGKSAILLALVVGLGGKASATNRGSSLKDFVKKGERSAVVEVTLDNSGLYPFKPEIYGERITVVRTIAAAGGVGGGYKIKSASGAVVSSKRADLDRLLEALKIQVDNPVAVLNQDTSRDFLNSADPRAKYTLFMRATQMDTVVAEHDYAIRTRAEAVAALNVKQEVMAQQERTLKALKDRFRALQSVPQQRRRIEELENEIIWAQVLEKEKELAEAEAVVAAETAKLAALQSEADGLGTQGANMKERHGALNASLTELRVELAATEARFAEAKAQHTRRKEAAQAAQRENRTQDARVERQRGNARALRQEIDRLEQTTGPDYLARRQAQKEHVARVTEQRAQAQAALATGDLHLAQLRANEEPLREEKHALRAEQVEAGRAVGRTQRELEGLRNDRGNLSVYGHHTVPLAERIEAAVAAGHFAQRPVGPLGAHVKLRDGDAAWSGAIEQLLSGLLGSYAVDNPRDRAKLLKLMGEVLGDRRKPTIINSRFMDVKHDVSRHRVAAPSGVQALIDTLVIDNIQVFNTLVDHSQIEKVVLIPGMAAAVRMMQHAGNVPRNCSRGITPNGDVFFPAPNWRTYAGKSSYSSRYLTVSAADRIAQLQVALAQAVQAQASVQQRTAALDADLARLGAEIRAANDERGRLTRGLHKIGTELTRLRDAEEPEVSSISTLTGELNECLEQLSALEAEAGAAAQALAAALADLEAAKVAANELRDQGKELAAREQPLLEEMERIRGDLTESATSQRYREERVRGQQAHIKVVQKAAKVVQTAADQLVANAEEVTPRLVPKGSVTQLNDERRRLEAAVRSIEEDKGSYVAVGDEYIQLKAKFNATNDKVKATHLLLKRLSKMIKARASIYESVRRLVSWIVTLYFHQRLAQRKYTGELTIDHTTKVLNIEVAPAHRGDGETSKDTRTLSGGERSYATVVFIMALWDAVQLPFYFMDEFDVFMDKVNRKVIMSMLMEHAKQRHGRQFVFLTPQDIASVATDRDVTIHRMENPRE